MYLRDNERMLYRADSKDDIVSSLSYVRNLDFVTTKVFFIYASFNRTNALHIDNK